MNQFTERKKALLNKINSLTDDTIKALGIIKDVQDCIDSENHILVDEDIVNNERAVIRISKNDEQVLAVWYADDALGLDFDPEDEDSDPIEITGKDADAVREAIESLIEQAKAASESKPKDSIDTLLEAIGKVFETTSSKDEEINKVLIKIINTIEDLEGPKYEKLHACWHKDVLLLSDDTTRILVIAKSPVSGFKVTATPNKGPGSLITPTGRAAELTAKVFNLVQGKVKNDFAGHEKALDQITSLFNVLPDNVQDSIIKDIIHKLNM